MKNNNTLNELLDDDWPMANGDYLKSGLENEIVNSLIQDILDGTFDRNDIINISNVLIQSGNPCIKIKVKLRYFVHLKYINRIENFTQCFKTHKKASEMRKKLQAIWKGIKK